MMNSEIINNEPEYIYMLEYAESSERDWYGDFSYYSCELDKYISKSKLWEYKIIHGSSHGLGHAGVKVKTTMEALKLLGWETDYEKHKATEKIWD